MSQHSKRLRVSVLVISMQCSCHEARVAFSYEEKLNAKETHVTIFRALAVTLMFVSPIALSESAMPAPAAVVAAYDRLLPLAGGSNFRDMGGYFVPGGGEVRRGLLFRSGAMTSLTEADQAYLSEFGFARVIDLRTNEERELYPNHWAQAAGLELLANDYGFEALVAHLVSPQGEMLPMTALYEAMPAMLKPQLAAVFSSLLSGQAPLLVNCSAGQDRTGLASALVLLSLGVPRDVVMQDYLASTRYRRPQFERGDVDLAAAAQSNAFARMMLAYSSDKRAAHAEPLMTADGMPYLHFALQSIESQHGSVERYLEQELGVDAEDVLRLRQMYIQAP